MAAVPPGIVVDQSVRVPCSCGETTVWPYRAGGRGLNALPHPTDEYALIQHVNDGPCGRIRRYPPLKGDVPESEPAAPSAPAADLTLFDLDTQEIR